MPTPVSFNRTVDRQQLLSFVLQLRNKETGELYDISAWQFHFTLKNGAGTTIWDVPNASFTRADNNTISFEKSVANVQAVSEGYYTISLLVTNSDMTDNEWINGTWNFKN